MEQMEHNHHQVGIGLLQIIQQVEVEQVEQVQLQHQHLPQVVPVELDLSLIAGPTVRFVSIDHGPPFPTVMRTCFSHA